MTLTAEVIVDVPTMQTDQPFTYLVPSEMETALQVGMRVEVPFGTVSYTHLTLPTNSRV